LRITHVFRQTKTNRSSSSPIQCFSFTVFFPSFFLSYSRQQHARAACGLQPGGAGPQERRCSGELLELEAAARRAGAPCAGIAALGATSLRQVRQPSRPAAAEELESSPRRSSYELGRSDLCCCVAGSGYPNARAAFSLFFPLPIFPSPNFFHITFIDFIVKVSYLTFPQKSYLYKLFFYLLKFFRAMLFFYFFYKFLFSISCSPKDLFTISVFSIFNKIFLQNYCSEY